VTKLPKFIQSAKTTASLLALVCFAGCASLRSTSSNRIDQQVAQANIAYRQLHTDHAAAYNNAVASIARHIDGETPDELRSQLEPLGVTLDQPQIKLRLARYHVAPASRRPNESSALGAPMLLEYDTTNAALYPRDGLMISATAVYRRVEGKPHLSLLSGKNRIKLDGSTYPLNIDNVAPIAAMARRGRHVARGGLSYMLRPGAMRVKPGIYLIEPYDPKKKIVLMVPGLQSTPFAFVDLLKAMRRDPEVSEHFQVWTFLYGTGAPVLFNALELRQDLEKTIRAVDPHDRDLATRHIVVLGHSMGGLLAHTLVSSSGEKLWNALFTVPSRQIRGDPATIRRLSDAMHFRRNLRVVRAIFAATPHRGSKLADSWIGRIGASLIRLPPDLQTDIVDIVSGNSDAATVAGQAFAREMNFSAVRTLSPRDPALNALADLPIEVPSHSIIGQHNAGPIERSSDGVVAYASAQLEGAASELVVGSGHNVCENRDGQSEIIRILRLELQRGAAVARAIASDDRFGR
jgi:triacylglycerol esterase/lipase EstA (alpha/beta hydrolase family)